MEYPKFCYRYVPQPSLYKRYDFVCVFSLHFSQNKKKSPKYPKIEIVTDGYQVLFIRLSPLSVAFHPKNDLIIEIMHL